MERVYLNDKWKFSSQGSDEIEVRLPHTTKEVPFNYFDENDYQMLSNYKKVIDVPKDWESKRVFLTVEGAAHSSQLLVNGKKIREHHCGYTGFTTEITKELKAGETNELEIIVDSRENQNIPPFGYVVDYMTFGGIYRDVYLDIKENDYIKDVFVRTKELNDFEFEIITEIDAECSNNECMIKQFLIKGENRLEINRKYVKSGKQVVSEKVDNIELWSPQTPNLYLLETELWSNGKIVDTKTVRFGFRTAIFKKDGFYLNGKKYKIRGLNRHQSYPYVGYAMPESMQKYDADILKKELGCNAVRTSHYPQSHHFIDRCDELGLLVFMEFPGWQFIGDEQWKLQALENEREMITQFRNHTSIILWGVRINESKDDDDFYKRTNKLARELDPGRQTGGVRCHKNSNLFEDVYTYNDFSHEGTKAGCEKKSKITSDNEKPYMISEYNGHMFPTKSFDAEEHRVEHALRHARVLDSVIENEDISGSFGWCMFDYNTHKDFGSGDRICYHGVMDMFRNPKLASWVYACEGCDDIVLELSSSMDIGEHPACNRGFTYILSNADSVRMYKNDEFIKEYTTNESPFKNLKHGPIIIDDFIGDKLIKSGKFKEKQAKELTKALNYVATHGVEDISLQIKLIALKTLTLYHMKFSDTMELYNKYVGDWGGTSTIYRFDAIKDGKVVKSITKEPMKKVHIKTKVSHNELIEKTSYDVAQVRIVIADQNENQAFFYNDPIELKAEGPIEIIGPTILPVRGGMTGVYIKTTGETGTAKLILSNPNLEEKEIEFNVKKEKNN